ncbi:MAG: hypothetical protein GY821_06160 [Gammaproteobacteria bacterium]|nr:hypothetical protein [Gammaproteobacteria bacterium]
MCATVARTGKKLKTPAATRWISLFLVSDRFVELKDAIEVVAKEQHWPVLFSWDTVEAVRDLLKPIFQLVTILEADNVSTASSLIPLLLGLESFLMKWKTESRFELFNSVCTNLWNGIDSRCSKFLHPDDTEFDPTFLICSMLDPTQSNFLTENTCSPCG